MFCGGSTGVLFAMPTALENLHLCGGPTGILCAIPATALLDQKLFNVHQSQVNTDVIVSARESKPSRFISTPFPTPNPAPVNFPSK